MTGTRIKSVLLLSVLLIGTLAISVTAKDPKAVAPETLGFSSERLARIDKAMQEDIDQKKTGGIVVLVARHGTIAYHKAFGMADIESGKKMQTDSLFRLYSMTKPVTSVALLSLYEEGKFQLSDPLEKYIPAFKDVKVYVRTDDKGAMVLEEPKRKITIQDVFRHTAGFSYGSGDTPVDKAYQQAGIDFSKMNSLKELVDKLAKLPLLYQPGERWVYSVAHDVQAYLVEYFSGMPFDKYVQSKILQPLGDEGRGVRRPKGICRPLHDQLRAEKRRRHRADRQAREQQLRAVSGPSVRRAQPFFDNDGLLPLRPDAAEPGQARQRADPRQKDRGADDGEQPASANPGYRHGGGTGYGLGVSVADESGTFRQSGLHGPVRLGRRRHYLGDHRSRRKIWCRSTSRNLCRWTLAISKPISDAGVPGDHRLIDEIQRSK